MTPEAIAAAILANQRARRAIPADWPFAPADEAAGHAAQRALAALMGAEPPAGFKVGAIAPRMQQYLGVFAPIAGFVAAPDLNRGHYRFADYVAPGVECEIGLRLARDLPAGPTSLEAASAAVGEVFAAIELVDNRYEDFGKSGPAVLIADRMFQAGGVTGAPVRDWRGLDLPSLLGTIAVDGEVRDQGPGSELMGHPFKVLAWLAASPLAQAFGGLKAGQVVFLGSVTPPLWLKGPGRITVAFEGLGEASLTLV
ncbi:sulfate adenylyltransferase [Acetobacteraceae bacterium H6797]|nr:sulfate adenylyltransferase [Acetobacteraceae bacterium H6797]